MVAAHAVRDDESIISITSDGLMVRQRVIDITVVGRSGMGVRLVRLTEGASLVSVSVVAAEPDESEAPAVPAADETVVPVADATPVASESASDEAAPTPPSAE